MARYVAGLAPDACLEPVRTFEDGPYVVVQSTGRVRGDGAFFDVFRFEGDLAVEHWGFAAPAGPPNLSGHTQVDGPVEPRGDADTARRKALVRDYYDTVHLSGRHDQIPRFMPGGRQTRHEPGVEDGVDAFARDLAVITRDRTIDELRLLIGQGDFAFLVAEGTHRGEPCAYVDLYRVEDDQLVEHWGFPQPMAAMGSIEECERHALNVDQTSAAAGGSHGRRDGPHSIGNTVRPCRGWVETGRRATAGSAGREASRAACSRVGPSTPRVGRNVDISPRRW